MRRTLYLGPPSFSGFDGGAGSRYQAKREITSYWYPTWLAQPAAMTPGSKLIDAPPHGLGVDEVLREAAGYELVLIHTSTPSLANDIRCAEAIKEQSAETQVGFLGAHTAVLPEETLRQGACLDFVCRAEFDHTCVELAHGLPMERIAGLSYRRGDGAIVHNEDRPMVTDWDTMPSVLPVYSRDLDIRNYSIGYLLHPYISFYTGRGCPARCSFCLWPQTIGGHRYRAKSPAVVIREMEEGKRLFPIVREWMFDDDTFTADRARAVEIGRGMKALGLTWSCNARAHVDFDTLKDLRDSGLRLLLVGFESGNQAILDRIHKGIRLDMARQFMTNCRKLGIKVHGTFIIGLPIETRETVEETIRFAQELDPHTIQVSIAAPYPGTELYSDAIANGWMQDHAMVAGSGIQTGSLQYPNLSIDEMEEAVARMYSRFYFRFKPIFRIVREMAADRQMLARRLREGQEFFAYLGERRAHRTSRHEGDTHA